MKIYKITGRGGDLKMSNPKKQYIVTGVFIKSSGDSPLKIVHKSGKSTAVSEAEAIGLFLKKSWEELPGFSLLAKPLVFSIGRVEQIDEVTYR